MANMTSKDRIWLEASMGPIVGSKLADLYDALDTIVTSTTLPALTITTLTTGALPLTTYGAGAVAAGKCTATEYGDGVIHQTALALTLTGTNDLDLADGNHGTGVKVYTFPAGRILILGATIDASVAYNNKVTGNFYLACGSAVGADDADLTSTEADIIPRTTIDGSQTSPEDWHAALAASAHFDGTATAKDLYVNVACPDASNTGASTYAITGTLTITWINLGDY